MLNIEVDSRLDKDDEDGPKELRDTEPAREADTIVTPLEEIVELSEDNSVTSEIKDPIESALEKGTVLEVEGKPDDTCGAGELVP